MKQTFQDAFGEATLNLEYHEAGNYISAEFIGFQSLPVLEQASELVYKILRETKCTKYLSDNTQLVGGKDFADNFILDEFIPKAMANGLRYVAYVISPQAYNIHSIEKLNLILPPELKLMLFDNQEDARYWLLKQ